MIGFLGESSHMLGVWRDLTEPYYRLYHIHHSFHLLERRDTTLLFSYLGLAIRRPLVFVSLCALYGVSKPTNQ